MGEITTVIPNIENSGRHNFGKIGPDKTPVITLPGDPIAAYLSAELFVRPMIRTMLGAANIHRTILKATLTHDIESPIGTTSLVRASIVQNGKLTVTALADQETLATLSDAQGLIAIAGDSPGAVKGEIVDVILLERAT
jgi:molybdopterin biosynthesis enzyme